MAINSSKRGIALIIAIIVMTVMLSFGLALGSLAYKQQVLSSSAIESTYAFYAADAALECALYADQQAGLFELTTHSQINHPAMITSVACSNFSASESSYSYVLGSQLSQVQRLSLDNGYCADVTINKFSSGSTYIYAQGYDAPCATVADPVGKRFVARGLYAYY